MIAPYPLLKGIIWCNATPPMKFHWHHKQWIHSFCHSTSSQFTEWLVTYLDLQIVSIGEPGRCMLYWISCLSTMKISFLGVPSWYSVRQYCATPASTGKAFLFLQNLLTTHTSCKLQNETNSSSNFIKVSKSALTKKHFCLTHILQK